MENNGIGISQTPCRSQQNFFTNYVLVPKMQGSLPLAHLVALESHYTKETSPKKKKKKKNGIVHIALGRPRNREINF